MDHSPTVAASPGPAPPAPRRSSHAAPGCRLGAAPALGLALALELALAATAAAQPNDLASLFPSQAAIEAPVAGRLVRLDLPAEVVAACRADLSDLRVFDAAGREVPFVLEGFAGGDAGIEAFTTARAEIVDASRETIDRDDAPPLRRETFVLSAPPPAPPGGGWKLALTVGGGDFVGRIEARAAQWSSAAGEPVVASGSVFRLREIPAEKLGLALPAAIAAAPLVVTIDTEGTRFLEPAFSYQSRRRIESSAAELAVALEVRSRDREQRSTVVVLDRPAGLVPARLRLATSTQFFRRVVEVWDEGDGARGEVLGRAPVFRVQAGPRGAGIGEPAAAVEELDVPLAAASGDALRVVIDDGDSPGLDEVVFTAVLPRPALLFALPGDDAPVSATLRFGGGRAYSPRYDVAALPPPLPAAGENAAVAEILHDGARLPAVSLGVITANPEYDPQPALAWAWRPGAAIDPRLWSHQIELEARPSPEGLSRLRLRVEDAGVARADFADLRLIDRERRQWAYLLDATAAHEALPLGIDGPRERERATLWTFHPPAAPATADGVVLRTPVAYFDRPYALVAHLGDEERMIASGRLVRAGGDPRPVLIAFPAARFDRLELEIVDGDDAPLALEAAEAHFLLPEMFFAVPEGSYAVLVGYPDASAPSYELERARDVVLAVRSAPVVSGGIEANLEFSPSARLASGEGWQRALLWGAIVVLVGFLTVLTLRLARSSGGK